MKDRLIELLNEATFGVNKHTLADHLMSFAVEGIADHLLANGVIVPPVKVGQTVYDIGEFLCGNDAPEMYELKDDSITFVKSRDGDYFLYDSIEMSCGDIGKTVFLTREEAEKALAERSEK